jgi:glyoxylase-like metal-dependent hydrolase (beta-lactamase superfamily II)
MALYLRQLEAGVDFGRANPYAQQMGNYIYLVGCDQTKQCLVLDPAWDPQAFVDRAAEDGMELVGVICTHHHADHLGGTVFGMEIEGLRELLELLPPQAPVYIQELELPWATRGTQVPADRFTILQDQSTIQIGEQSLLCHLTPGHTEGGMCVEGTGALITADTLFLQGCGRVDLPGGNAGQLFDSLQKLKSLDGSLEVYCGHSYSGASASLAQVIQTNPIFRYPTKSQFQAVMG